jgi:hypothetical protein
VCVMAIRDLIGFHGIAASFSQGPRLIVSNDLLDLCIL